MILYSQGLRGSSFAALACGLLAGTAAQAQEVRGPEQPTQSEQALSPATTATPPAAEASPMGATTSSAADQGLADIVVTARRVAENQQRVPVAVTAQTGEALQRQNAVRVADIGRLSPGISFAAASSTATAVSITVRGQVQTDVLATLDPSVGTYVDGFYWARAYGLNSDLLDLQSAQVLRGPQGTLFGRNTTGGALLLQTNDPNFDGISGLVSGTYGRFDERVGTVVVNVPLVEDKVAVRGAFSINKRDGFFRDELTGRKLGERDSRTARVKLLLKPTENFSLLLSGEYFKTDALTRPYQLRYVGATSAAANINAALEANPANAALLGSGTAQLISIGAGIFSNYIGTHDGTDRVQLNEDPRSYAKTQTYTATGTIDTYFGSVKFIGGYRKVDASANVDLDGSPSNVVRTLGTQSLESYSGEAQINGKAFDDSLDFVGGAFAFHEGGFDASTSLALPTLTTITAKGMILPRTIYRGDIDTNSIGVYAQGTYRFTDQFSAVGGLRYSIDDKGITSRNRTVNNATDALIGCLIPDSQPGTCRIHRNDEFKGLSYTFGLNYQITPDTLVYAKTSKGFRSGGQNLRASGSAGSAFVPFQPEIAREEEVGFKGQFFDRRVRFNLAAFYNEVSDIQRTALVTTVIDGVTSTSTIVGNAGKARFYGGEAELAARLFPSFTLSATGAIVKPKYLSFEDASGDRTDEAFQNVSKYSFSVAGDYDQDLGFGRGLLHVDYAWQSRQALYNYRGRVTGGQTAADVVGFRNALTRRAGGELNARAAVSVMDNNLEVAVFGRNILDRRYFNTGLGFFAPLNVASVQRNDPATYGVTATFRFGG